LFEKHKQGCLINGKKGFKKQLFSHKKLKINTLKLFKLFKTRQKFVKKC